MVDVWESMNGEKTVGSWWFILLFSLVSPGRLEQILNYQASPYLNGNKIDPGD